MRLQQLGGFGLGGYAQAQAYVYVGIAPLAPLLNRYLVKIGMSRSPDGRIVSLVHTSPFPISFFRLWRVPGEAKARKIEERIHRDMAPFRTRGEWYLLHPKDDKAMLWETVKGRVKEGVGFGVDPIDIDQDQIRQTMRAYFNQNGMDRYRRRMELLHL